VRPADACLFGVLVVAHATLATAQPKVETSVSAPQVEVGEPFEIELKAVVSEGDTPERPTLTPPAGLAIQGPSVGTRREMSFVNGTFETRKGITATWTLTAERPGSYVIGPPKVTWSGKPYDGQVVRIEVLAEGSLPRATGRRRGRGGFHDPFDFDPFDLLKRRRVPPLDDTDPGSLLAPPRSPTEFQLEHAPDPTAFLHATVAPSSAVVGEQVTLRIYAYGGRGAFDEVNTSEPSRSRFLSHVIVENSYRQPRYTVDIDDRMFQAVKVREIALLPLESGKLEIGPMRMGFRGRGYPATAAHRGLVRHTEPLFVDVTEPPVAGRPAGYRVGDVGRFQLAASVQPRAVQQGEAVSVTFTIDGTGFPPAEVHLPEQHGVEWLTPETNEQIRVRGATVGGTRTLSYVVQLRRPGRIELGEATLPYYDAERRRYEVARVSLGTVEVAPGAARAPTAVEEAPEEPPTVRLTDLASPRTHLGPPPPARTWYADGFGFWLLLGAGPLVVLGATGLARGASRLAAHRRARGASRAQQARDALTAARHAASGTDPTAAADVERAVYHAIEEATGLKARGILRSQLEDRLRQAGLAPELARDTLEVLDASEAARFAGSGAASTSQLDRGEDVVRRLLRARTDPS
jgi:hypothetical protein